MNPLDLPVVVREEGTCYELPTFWVGKDGLEEAQVSTKITFVRGSKAAEDNVKPVAGVLHEHLLTMMIMDLKHKHELVPSEFTEQAIDHLQAALFALETRQSARKKDGTLNTYNK